MINTSIPLSAINAMGKNTLLAQLGIVITEVGTDFIKGSMPVDHRTHQPMGLLHGGASAALIETLGSMGPSLVVDLNTSAVVGIEINANHVHGARTGIVTGTARLVHCGKTTHLWQVDVVDENQKLVCTGRLTVLVVQKK